MRHRPRIYGHILLEEGSIWRNRDQEIPDPALEDPDQPYQGDLHQLLSESEEARQQLLYRQTCFSGRRNRILTVVL
jgi:hypothetical protein